MTVEGLFHLNCPDEGTAVNKPGALIQCPRRHEDGHVIDSRGSFHLNCAGEGWALNKPGDLIQRPDGHELRWVT